MALCLRVYFFFANPVYILYCLTQTYLYQSLTVTNAVCQMSVVQVGGRLEAAPVEYNRCHPVVLSGESCMTELIAKHYHKAVGHAGVSHAFTVLRARYRNLGGSMAVRRVLAKCLSCRRNFRPCEQQTTDHG